MEDKRLAEMQTKIAALEIQVQELLKRPDWREIDRKSILGAISLEVGRLQKINDSCIDSTEICRNAECIVNLGVSFAKILRFSSPF